ncbi:LysR family transcriptional regulator [Streptomyces sp. NPDC048290]|uniref:LysR family transcriptional regulator n=1 Tax=Streptomyces sp. NPDC048290 TaxID=3155811 RepID=UPI003431C607
MDLNAVRTFVAVADSGQFQLAAVDLGVTQQAVSKRIAALERGLGVRLLARTARGAELTVDGQAFLPHARGLVSAEERAAAAVRPGRRALRVDVIGRRLSLAGALRDFHRRHPDVPLDVVTLPSAEAAVAALGDGTLDATFRAVTMPGQRLPDDIAAMPVLDEPLRLFTGPGHVLAGADAVTLAQLAGHRVWMPGNAPGTEWAAYYEALADAFGLTLDTGGPDFGVEALIDTVTASTTLVAFLGARTPLFRPGGRDLRLIRVVDPMPVYPHSLLWHTGNPHPALAPLRAHLAGIQPRRAAREPGTWRPAWARHAGATTSTG